MKEYTTAFLCLLVVACAPLTGCIDKQLEAGLEKLSAHKQENLGRSPPEVLPQEEEAVLVVMVVEDDKTLAQLTP